MIMDNTDHALLCYGATSGGLRVDPFGWKELDSLLPRPVDYDG